MINFIWQRQVIANMIHKHKRQIGKKRKYLSEMLSSSEQLKKNHFKFFQTKLFSKIKNIKKQNKTNIKDSTVYNLPNSDFS